MKSSPRVLVQLDPDKHASLFDAMVAVDADVDHLIQYANVSAEDVAALVHGAIFTRGVDHLHNSAIFVGGTDVTASEAIFGQVTDTFFGPLRVSVMLDANGANSTAAAAVVKASQHLTLSECRTLILAGTGSVGQRLARLLAGQGADVLVASRVEERAARVCVCETASLQSRGLMNGTLRPVQTATAADVRDALEGVQLVIAAGAAGVELVSHELWSQASELKAAIDLNAVPPLGIGGTEVNDKAVERDGVVCYGAIGVGGTKMKIHKTALRKLFTQNDWVLDAEEMLQIGFEL